MWCVFESILLFNFDNNNHFSIGLHSLAVTYFNQIGVDIDQTGDLKFFEDKKGDYFFVCLLLIQFVLSRLDRVVSWFKYAMARNQLVMMRRLGDLLHLVIEGELSEIGIIHSHIYGPVSKLIVRAILGDSVVNIDDKWSFLFDSIQSALGRRVLID